VCVECLGCFLERVSMSDKKGIIRATSDVVIRATAKALIKEQIDRMEGVTDKPTLSELIVAKAIARMIEGAAKDVIQDEDE